MGGEVGRGMDVEAFPRLEALADGILMLHELHYIRGARFDACPSTHQSLCS